GAGSAPTHHRSSEHGTDPARPRQLRTPHRRSCRAGQRRAGRRGGAEDTDHQSHTAAPHRRTRLPPRSAAVGRGRGAPHPTGPTRLVLAACDPRLDGVAARVNAVLAAVAELRILTTSRTPLRHTAEHVYLLDQLPSAEAEELFIQRARAARPTVTIEADTVASLVDHLDGLPLAIELAAARTRTLTAESILDNLTDRFALLRGGDRTAPERHQTLQAVIDWSWQLLDDEAKTALMTMSLLPDAFGTDCAADILGTT